MNTPKLLAKLTPKTKSWDVAGKGGTLEIIPEDMAAMLASIDDPLQRFVLCAKWAPGMVKKSEGVELILPQALAVWKNQQALIAEQRCKVAIIAKKPYSQAYLEAVDALENDKAMFWPAPGAERYRAVIAAAVEEFVDPKVSEKRNIRNQFLDSDATLLQPLNSAKCFRKPYSLRKRANIAGMAHQVFLRRW